MDDFYRAFEDRYRGSRDLIKSRLAKYEPFVRPLAALYPGAMTFDVGCGRGEWLELMIEAGFAATGMDLDAGMLEVCRERNLPAFQGDAIERLAELNSSSHALVSAFHVVEHVSFEQLKTLVSEALRVLKPGGLLILETPNPENIQVATCDFYLDPSHQKPVPPLLLSFVAEHTGFDRVKVVRLQEPAELNDRGTEIHLLNILCGVSFDYAVVAQKDASSIQGTFDAAFNSDYGLTIDVLATRYEARLASNIYRVDARVRQVEAVVHQANAQLHRENAQLHQENAQLHQENAQLHQENAQLHAVHHSTSWRITRPVRIVGPVLKGQGKAACKTGLKRLIRRAARFVEAHPSFRRLAVSAFNRVPGVKQRLIRFVAGTARSHLEVPPGDLSPRAQQIHAALVFAAKSDKNHEGA